MNVKDLREFIADIPDDVEVVIEGGDHGYVSTQVLETDACWSEKENDLTECHWKTDKEMKKYLGDDYVRVPVLLIT